MVTLRVVAHPALRSASITGSLSVTHVVSDCVDQSTRTSLVAVIWVFPGSKDKSAFPRRKRIVSGRKGSQNYNSRISRLKLTFHDAKRRYRNPLNMPEFAIPLIKTHSPSLLSQRVDSGDQNHKTYSQELLLWYSGGQHLCWLLQRSWQERGCSRWLGVW